MNTRHPHLYFILFFGAALAAGLLIATQWVETSFLQDTLLMLAPRVQEAHAQKREKPPQQNVKGLYLTSSSAGNPKKLGEIMDLIDKTELNAVVIDIKDYSGKILYNSHLLLVNELGTKSNQLGHAAALIQKLHDRHIYVIARQTVFQDPLLAQKKPEWAIKSKGGGLWHDNKGLTWVDPTQEAVWRYNLAIAKETIRLGFDEINFDYVRFPSDGDMSQVVYTNGAKKRHAIMRDFYQFLSDELKDEPAWISFDMFGFVMERSDDLSIGQRLVDAVDETDYIAPMMYPSHYPPGHLGLANPAASPAVVLENGLQKGAPRFIGKRAKLRPWIQGFNLGAVYDAGKIRTEIDEVEKYTDAGWMLWNAGNRYSDAGLKLETGKLGN